MLFATSQFGPDYSHLDRGFQMPIRAPQTTPLSYCKVNYIVLLLTAAFATVAPAQVGSISFGSVPINETSVPEGIGICNAGGGDILISSATLGGPNASAFSIVQDSCSGADLAASCANACSVSAIFSPITLGTYNAEINFASNIGIFYTPMSGVGVAPPSEHTFSPQEKADAEATAIELGFTAELYQTLALNPACIALDACAEIAETFALLTNAAELPFDIIADDPIDPNYTVIPQPQPYTAPTSGYSPNDIIFSVPSKR